MTFDKTHSEPGLITMTGNNISIRNKLEKKNQSLIYLLYKDQQSIKMDKEHEEWVHGKREVQMALST